MIILAWVVPSDGAGDMSASCGCGRVEERLRARANLYWRNCRAATVVPEQATASAPKKGTGFGRGMLRNAKQDCVEGSTQSSRRENYDTLYLVEPSVKSGRGTGSRVKAPIPAERSSPLCRTSERGCRATEPPLPPTSALPPNRSPKVKAAPAPE